MPPQWGWGRVGEGWVQSPELGQERPRQTTWGKPEFKSTSGPTDRGHTWMAQREAGRSGAPHPRPDSLPGGCHAHGKQGRRQPVFLGRELFSPIRCAGCHLSQISESKTLGLGPPSSHASTQTPRSGPFEQPNQGASGTRQCWLLSQASPAHREGCACY